MSGSEARVLVRVYPNAAKSEVVDFAQDVLRVRVAAPPVKGKANKELIAFLSQCVGVGKERLSIIKGYTSRDKVIVIEGLTKEEVLKRLLPS